MALAIFMIPFLFVHSPDLLMINPVPLVVVGKCITATMGAYALSIAIVRFVFTEVLLYERVFCAIAGLLLSMVD